MHRFRPYHRYLRQVKVPLVLSILCGIFYGASSGAGLPLMLNYVFPKVFASADAAAPVALTGWQIALVAAWLPMVFLLRGIADYANVYLLQYAGTRVLEAIRLDYFKKLQVLPLAFFQKRSTGDLISRGIADTSQLQVALVNVTNDLIKQPATLVFAISAVAYLAFREQGVAMVLASLAVVPVCVLPIRFIGKKIVRRAARVQEELGSLSGRMSENLSAIREVRAFGLEDYEARRFSTTTRALIKAQMKVVKYQRALNPMIEFVSALGVSITFIYAYRVGVALEAFIPVVGALFMCYDPIKKLGMVNTELKRGSAALDRLEVVFNEPVDIADPAQPVAVTKLRGDLAFEDVTFHYGPDTPALSSVDVRIPRGTVCALVGPTGAGKSTFANLVPRFYDATEGRVTIDGIDVRAMRLADLRRNIAIVSQEPVLFNDTIANNLLLSRPDASRAEIEQAAKDAFAHDFILEKEHGYDTVIGERGQSLSGGQRQRLALARAFLRNAPILILDEATSALDARTEEQIQQALSRLMVGKTVLIIAHRFSTIRDATKILVFQGGRIVASGDHATLHAANDLYRTLYETQRAAGKA
ncbi:MAG: ABC transporter ATP-binding protein [Opitutaceae bacterium]|nr:ABC transporter ATP-binding protein [Opitutaceae bacterium]